MYVLLCFLIVYYFSFLPVATSRSQRTIVLPASCISCVCCSHYGYLLGDLGLGSRGMLFVFRVCLHFVNINSDLFAFGGFIGDHCYEYLVGGLDVNTNNSQ
jgi:hypothetical protein